MPKLTLPSFAAGELSDTLTGRVDLAKYAVGAKTLKNMIVHKHGGVSNRAGTEFVCDAHNPVRMIPFEFNTEQSYILEFTSEVMRVIKDGALVTEFLTDTETVYKWTVSPTVTGGNTYYLTKIDGTAPDLVTYNPPKGPTYYEYNIFEDGDLMTFDGATVTTPEMAEGEFSYGDTDSLGFDTLYVRIVGSGDPDAEADGYLYRHGGRR